MEQLQKKRALECQGGDIISEVDAGAMVDRRGFGDLCLVSTNISQFFCETLSNSILKQNKFKAIFFIYLSLSSLPTSPKERHKFRITGSRLRSSLIRWSSCPVEEFSKHNGSPKEVA